MKIRTEKMLGFAVSMVGVGIGYSEVMEMRPLSADRPDATESPYTVDEGRIQIEMEVMSLTRDGSGETYRFGEMNFKYGVGVDTDVQLVMLAHEHQVGGASGFGDMQLRVKHNLWGNDGGDMALAVMPFLQVPTGSSGVTSGEFEGGLIVPFAMSGKYGWEFGFQAEVDLVANETKGGHHFEFLGSAVAARDLTETLGMFFELVGIVGEGTEGATEAYFNTGMTWAAEENLQFDWGVRVGLTSDSEDVTPFFGVSKKF